MKVATRRLRLRRTQSTSGHSDQCGDVVEELEVWAVTVRRRAREFLLTLWILRDLQEMLVCWGHGREGDFLLRAPPSNIGPPTS